MCVRSTTQRSTTGQYKRSVHKPGKALTRFRSLRLPEFSVNRHMNVAKLSALSTSCLYLPENTPGTNLKELNRPQGQTGAGRIMSMNISNDTPNTPSEIAPETFLLELQCLNQLRHRVPLRPAVVINVQQCCTNFPEIWAPPQYSRR